MRVSEHQAGAGFSAGRQPPGIPPTGRDVTGSRQSGHPRSGLSLRHVGGQSVAAPRRLGPLLHLVKAELTAQCRRGALHGLRAMLFLLGVGLVLGLPWLISGGSIENAARSGAPSVGLFVLALAVAATCGSAATSTLARDRDAGGLELLLLAGLRPVEIVGARILAVIALGGTILGQSLLVHGLAAVVGVPLGEGVRSFGVGLLLLVTFATVGIYGQLVADAPRPWKHHLRASAALFVALWLPAAVASGSWLPTTASPLATIALFDVAALFLACRLLARSAPDVDEVDEDHEALRRRLSSRTMAGRDVRFPVFEAARIPTRRSWLSLLATATSVLAAGLAGAAVGSRVGGERYQVALVLGLGIYVPGALVAFAREVMAMNPASSGFALLAATPLPARRILLERICGKAATVPLLLLPLVMLAALPHGGPLREAAGTLVLLAASLLAAAATIAARSRRAGGGMLALDLFLALVLMLAVADAMDRFRATWLWSASPPGLVATLGLSCLYLLAALGSLLAAVHHLETARRHVA